MPGALILAEQKDMKNLIHLLTLIPGAAERLPTFPLLSPPHNLHVLNFKTSCVSALGPYGAAAKDTDTPRATELANIGTPSL